GRPSLRRRFCGAAATCLPRLLVPCGSHRYAFDRRQSMDGPEITSDPAIMMGKPVVVGTRITVEHILEELAAGTSVEQLLKAHAILTREAVSAAPASAGAVR